MNEGGDVVERKIRTRSIEVPKEKDYVCGKCSAKGDCADSYADAHKKHMVFYWDETQGEHGKIICVKCGHWLETKEELYENLPVKEIQQYGFWIRFAKEHFIPCDICQDELHNLLFDKTIWTTIPEDKEMIKLEIRFAEDKYRVDQKTEFKLNFVFKLDQSYRTGGYVATFRICGDCQHKLEEILLDEELCIGNKDTEPAIELWRKWEYMEEPDEKTKERIKDWKEE